MTHDFVPVNEPLLDGNEIKYVSECLKTGWISSEGAFVERFEKQLAERVNRNFGIAVSNGTSALEIAVGALNLKPGDEVILPSMTIISCAWAIVRSGVQPVTVDCDPDTWNMDISAVAAAITPRTRAVMAVHIYGLPVDMTPLMALAKKHDLYIIEDAAEAIGQTYGDSPCGSFGTISTFSFYANKHITTGEGGMVLTNDPELAERCRRLRNLCFQPEARFVHEEMSGNHRLTNVQAAIGVSQLEKLDEHIAKKKWMGQWYQERLAHLSGVQHPIPFVSYSENHYWVYGMVLNDSVSFDAKEIIRRLGMAGVGARPFFWPIHQQPVFIKNGWLVDKSHPVSERLARRGFYIPSGLALTEKQMEKVAITLEELL